MSKGKLQMVSGLVGLVLLTCAPVAVAETPAQSPTPKTAAVRSKSASASASPAGPVGVATKSGVGSAERERDGLVELRMQNRTVALGVVLAGDGRILTALSAIGRGIGLTVRYADGSVTPLRVIHADRGWDLALVSPNDQRWTKGLLASKRDPVKDGLALRVLRLDANRKLRSNALSTPHRENLTGGDAALLAHAMTFSPTLLATDIGAPIVDENSDVVGLVTQACLPTTLDRCVPIVFAVPTTELKRFVREGATGANAPLPWLGITVVSESSSAIPATRIASIGANSPAATLGLRAGKRGDILLAVDGTPIGSPKDFGEVLHRHRAFDRVTLLLLAEGRYREVHVTLGRYPEAAKSRSSVQGQPDLGY